MPFERIDNIGLAVRDLRAVAGFFEQQLTADVTYHLEADPPSAVVQLSNGYLYLFQTSSSKFGAERHSVLASNPPGFDHVTFAVDDIETAYETLSSRGVEFDGPPEYDEQWDLLLAGFSDPDGNRYYIVQSGDGS